MSTKDPHRFKHGCNCARCKAYIESHPCAMCGDNHGGLEGCTPRTPELTKEIETWLQANMVPMEFKRSPLPPVIPCYHTRLSQCALWKLECCGAIVVFGMFQGGDMFSLRKPCYNEDCEKYGTEVHYSFVEYGCSECYLGNLDTAQFCVMIHNITEVTQIWKSRHSL